MPSRRASLLEHPFPDKIAKPPAEHPCPVGTAFRRRGEKSKRYIYVGRVNPDGSLLLRTEATGIMRSFRLDELIKARSMREGG